MKNKHNESDAITALKEAARDDIHLLKSANAAYRLLIGAILAGYLKRDNVIIEIEEFLKQTDNEHIKLVEKSTFLKDIKGEAFQELIKNYEYIKEEDFDFKNKKVLFIEDNYVKAGWNIIFSLILGKDKSECTTTITYLESKRNETACIFLDLRLPEKEEEGLELLKTIREKYPEIPVVIFSASDSVIYAKKAFELGAWDFFPKDPIDKENRDPVDYFLSLHTIVKKISSYDKNFVNKYWKRILGISEDLQKYDREEGSGLARAVRRELEKAYKHLIFNETYNYLPAFLEMEHNDEVIFCSSKAFECMMTLYTIEKEINVTKEDTLIIDEKGSPGIEVEVTDIMNNLKGIGALIFNIEENNSMEIDWISKAKGILKFRNKCIHGYLRAYEWKAYQTKPADKATADDFLGTTLELIEELIKNINKS